MSNLYLHESDICAEHIDDGLGSSVLRVFDADGEHRHDFPSDWTDVDVVQAVRFANKAFACGLLLGAKQKANEVRGALGLPALSLIEE